jgi:hypothetical protein
LAGEVDHGCAHITPDVARRGWQMMREQGLGKTPGPAAKLEYRVRFFEFGVCQEILDRGILVECLSVLLGAKAIVKRPRLRSSQTWGAANVFGYWTVSHSQM